MTKSFVAFLVAFAIAAGSSPAGSIFDNDAPPAAADVAAPLEQPALRAPVPPAAERSAALEIVREMYGLPVASPTPANVSVVSAKMAADALAMVDDPAGRYVLLDESRQLSLSVGDVAGAFRSTRLLCTTYEVDVATTEAASVKALATRPLDDGARELAADWGFGAADRAATAGDRGAADEILRHVQEIARPSKDADLRAMVKVRAADFTGRLASLAEVDAARTALRADGDDRAAHTKVGRHLCFVSGDWAAGLAHLAKGDDAALATIAAADVATGTEPARQVDTANAWWNYGKTADRPAKAAAIARATHWYKSALPNLTGLKRSFADRRLAEAEASVPERPPNGGGNVRGDGSSVVYVCDATGTMLGLKFELMKQQLARAIDALPEGTRFNIIFFRGGSTDAEWANPLSNKLLVATPAEKRDAVAFVGKVRVLGNGTNPIPALMLALGLRPDRMVFLTDGEFNNFVSYDDVLRTVGRLNVGQRTQVDTILMMGEDRKAEETLQKLAADAGGRFRKVLEADLRK
jgi:hypothetical protein